MIILFQGRLEYRTLTGTIAYTNFYTSIFFEEVRTTDTVTSCSSPRGLLYPHPEEVQGDQDR